MKNLLGVFVLLFSITAVPHSSHAQWVQMSSPAVGTVNSIAVNDSGLFAATSVGVFRTTDNGAAWTDVLPNVFGSAILACGHILLEVDATNGVYRSTNEGTSWTNVGLSGKTVGCLSLVPNGSGGLNVFAGSDGQGLFVSADTGATWNFADGTTPNTLFSNNIISLGTMGSTLFAGATDGTVSYTTDNGSDWFTAATPQGSEVTGLASIGSNLYAGVYSAGVYLSTNGGASWSPVNSGLTNKSIICLAATDSVLFAGTEAGVFRSIDGGTTWTTHTNEIATIDVQSLLQSANGLFAGTNGSGMYRSTNGGVDWSAIGIPIATVNTFVSNGAYLFAGTDYGVYRSNDDGATWTSASSGIPANSSLYPVNVMAVKDTFLFAGTLNGIFRSTDNGTSWSEYISGLTNTYIRSMLVAGTNVFAGTAGTFSSGGEVFISNSNGASWLSASSGLPTTAYVGIDALLAVGSDIFAGIYGAGVYLSTNSGVSWSASNSGMSGANVWSMALKGTKVFAGTDNGVFVSADTCKTWTQVNTGLTTSGVRIYSLAVSGSSIFAGEGNAINNNLGQIFLSQDDGANWSAINTGLSNAQVGGMTVSGSYVLAGTYQAGVWRRPLSDALPVELEEFHADKIGSSVVVKWKTAGEIENAGFDIERRTTENQNWQTLGSVAGAGTSNVPHEYSFIDKTVSTGEYSYRLKQIDRSGTFRYSNEVEATINVPRIFSLKQNYPDPFNPSTTIQFTVPDAGKATLEVYNILGQEVATLFDGNANGGQNYLVVFDGTRLSSGVYFTRLEFGGKSQLIKMVLAK